MARAGTFSGLPLKDSSDSPIRVGIVHRLSQLLNVLFRPRARPEDDVFLRLRPDFDRGVAQPVDQPVHWDRIALKCQEQQKRNRHG